MWIKQRLEFYDKRYKNFIENSPNKKNIFEFILGKRKEFEISNIAIENLYEYKYLHNKINLITFNFMHSNMHLLKFNDDFILDKKLSLRLENKFKENHKLNIDDFGKFKSDKSSLLKGLKNLLFNDMKINLNSNNLFYIQKGTEARIIDESLFSENQFFLNYDLKRIIDYLKCNILYENIPIYKTEYSELILNIKNYLYDYYFLRYANMNFYDIVYYTYSRNIILSLLDYYKSNTIEDFNKVEFLKQKNNKFDYLIYFGHHRTQNSIMKLLIPIENFTNLYKLTIEKNKIFEIIANPFCGTLKFELFSEKINDDPIQYDGLSTNLNCKGFKLFYENFDITHLIYPKILNKAKKRYALNNTNQEKNNHDILNKFKSNDYYIDLKSFEEFIKSLEQRYQEVILNFKLTN